MNLTSLGFKKPSVDPTVDAADLNIFVGDNVDLLNRKFVDIGFNVKDYGASGSSQTTTGSITTGTPTLTLSSTLDFVNGQGINILGINEIASLVITNAATSSSNVTITLNEVAFLVAVVSGDTAIQVAAKIRAASFAGWITGGTAGTDTVTFTSISVGNKTDATYSAGTTGATGTMTTPTQGTSGFITTILSGGGTTTLTLSSNASATFTSATIEHDDTAAILACYNAAKLVNGVVYFPPDGKYLVSDTITLIESVTIRGDTVGSNGSQIYTKTNKPIFYIPPNSGAMTIEGISFFGDNDVAKTLQDGIFVADTNVIAIKKCYFNGLYNSIHFKDTVFYSTIENCIFYSAKNAFFYGHGTSSGGYQVTFNNNIALCHESKYGFFFDNYGTVTMLDLEFSPTGCTDGGVVFYRPASLAGVQQITHCRFEGSATNGLQLLGESGNNVRYVSVVNTYIAGNPCVYAEYCNDITFDTCYFTGGGSSFSAKYVGDNIKFSNCHNQVLDVPLTAGIGATSISYDVVNPLYNGSFPFIYLPFLDPSVINRISVIGGKVGLHATPIDIPSFSPDKVRVNVAGVYISEAWITPTLVNSWINFGGTYSTVGYMKDSMGFVHLKGFIKDGTATAGSIILTLPTGYRSSQDLVKPSIASNAGTIVSFALEVQLGGNVIIGGVNAANTWLCLDGISFKAEQ